MSWRTLPGSNKTAIHRYYPGGAPAGSSNVYDSYYVRANSTWTWQTGNVWTQDGRHGLAICWVNDSDQPIRIASVNIQACACDSGGETYWSTSGVIGPCYGYGATYQCWINVAHDDGTFEQSDVISNDIPSIGSAATSHFDPYGKILDVPNMNSRGTSTTNTGTFGRPPYGLDPYSKYTGLQGDDYNITNCPVIEPGDRAYVHFFVGNFKGAAAQDNTIANTRFRLSAEYVNIDIKPVQQGYIWVYHQGQWELCRPFYIYNNGQWTSVEEGIK